MKIFYLMVLALFCSCTSKKENPAPDVVGKAAKQYEKMLEVCDKNGELLNPRTLDEKGNMKPIHYYKDWTAGFFPGSLWYLYKLTGDEKWKDNAVKFTETLDRVQYVTDNHDVGFMIGCSYLNGMRFANIDYSSVIVQSAKSLSTRFNPQVGLIKSWDVDKGWQSERGWEYPIIIDNMMNLELLFEASLLSNDSTFYKIAVEHADNTMKNHFRDDFSCYHVVDYSIADGSVRRKCTAQGYSDESAWARGQAWALYGYVMCYRYTKDLRYLSQAKKIYNFIFNNKNLPADLIPYWDYNAPNIPNEPRDVSSASVVASALYEMSQYVDDMECIEKADKILESLATDSYTAKYGTNGNFILMHSVGSIPHGFEIDVPLNYADYYYLEAIYRKRTLSEKK